MWIKWPQHFNENTHRIANGAVADEASISSGSGSHAGIQTENGRWLPTCLRVARVVTKCEHRDPPVLP